MTYQLVVPRHVWITAAAIPLVFGVLAMVLGYSWHTSNPRDPIAARLSLVLAILFLLISVSILVEYPRRQIHITEYGVEVLSLFGSTFIVADSIQRIRYGLTTRRHYLRFLRSSKSRSANFQFIVCTDSAEYVISPYMIDRETRLTAAEVLMAAFPLSIQEEVIQYKQRRDTGRLW